MMMGSSPCSMATGRPTVYILAGEDGFLVRPGTIVVDSTVRAIRFANATGQDITFEFRQGPFSAERPVLLAGQSGLVVIDWRSIGDLIQAYNYEVTVGGRAAKGNSEPTIIVDP